jgi:capsular exopolysaccharide synthesis family protein
LFNSKIESREEVVKRLHVPVIGDVVHTPKVKDRLLTPGSRNLQSEQLRLIRTNLSFTFKGMKVFLVTSSVASEGKSTFSINLASVLGMVGKKVALLEFDIRRPSVSATLGLDNNVGITDFLRGEITDLSRLCKSSEQLPNVHVFSSGTLPLNAADAILTDKVTDLFSELRKKYDFVIVDSAPAGMVSDAFLLSEHCDAVLYIIRQRFTQKKQLEFINDLHRSKKFKNMAIILNDVKTGGKYGYEGYGYENKNGYYQSLNTIRSKAFSWKKSKKLV